MSLPGPLKHTFTPEEIQFLTENQHITIIPSYSINKFELITDKLPKIVASQRVQVPIWLAVILKAQNKCRMVPPHWLALHSLQEFYTYEVENLTGFSELPVNWLELSKIFFENAPDDLHDPVYKLKSQIQDLQEVRLIKVKKGLSLINESHLQFDNLSLLEINEIRPFVVQVMSKLQKLHAASVEQPEDEDVA